MNTVRAPVCDTHTHKVLFVCVSNKKTVPKTLFLSTFPPEFLPPDTRVQNASGPKKKRSDEVLRPGT